MEHHVMSRPIISAGRRRPSSGSDRTQTTLPQTQKHVEAYDTNSADLKISLPESSRSRSLLAGLAREASLALTRRNSRHVKVSPTKVPKQNVVPLPVPISFDEKKLYFEKLSVSPMTASQKHLQKRSSSDDSCTSSGVPRPLTGMVGILECSAEIEEDESKSDDPTFDVLNEVPVTKPVEIGCGEAKIEEITPNKDTLPIEQAIKVSPLQMIPKVELGLDIGSIEKREAVRSSTPRRNQPARMIFSEAITFIKQYLQENLGGYGLPIPITGSRKNVAQTILVLWFLWCVLVISFSLSKIDESKPLVKKVAGWMH